MIVTLDTLEVLKDHFHDMFYGMFHDMFFCLLVRT